MTQDNKDNVSRLAEIATKFGVPTVLLVVVLYFVRSDLIVPLVETTRTLATAYEKLSGAMEVQTQLLRDIRDAQRKQ